MRNRFVMSEMGAKKEAHIVELTKLEPGRYEFEYELNTEFFQTIEKTELLGGKVNAKAVLNLREDDYDLTISEKGVVQVTCDRCLEPMDLDVDYEDDMEPEDGAKVLDLRWLAYEIIIVNLPLVHSHAKGECNPEMQQLLQTHLIAVKPESEDEDGI